MSLEYDILEKGQELQALYEKFIDTLKPGEARSWAARLAATIDIQQARFSRAFCKEAPKEEPSIEQHVPKGKKK